MFYVQSLKTWQRSSSAHRKGPLFMCDGQEREREKLCSYPSLTVFTLRCKSTANVMFQQSSWTCSIQWMLSIGAEHMKYSNNFKLHPVDASISEATDDMPRDSRRFFCDFSGMAGVFFLKKSMAFFPSESIPIMCTIDGYAWICSPYT